MEEILTEIKQDLKGRDLHTIFNDHIAGLLRDPDPVQHRQILSMLLDKVAAFDFKAKVGLSENELLTNRHRVILTIEHILDLAKMNNWGLCRKHDFIYLYNGAFWNLLDKDELMSFLGDAAQRMGVDKYLAGYFRFKEDLYKQFLVSAFLPVPKQARDMIVINLQNGSFEISQDGTSLRGFKKEDFLTYQLPFKFDPQATAPLFMVYLDRVLPDKNLQSVIAEYFGYIFVRSERLKLEKTLLLYGEGANGKSVLFDIINALLGENNFSCFSLQNLTKVDGYQRASLANKLVNYASEINGRLDVGIFKQLVSGEPVEARQIFGKPFIMVDYAKLVFNCNVLPKDIEHTVAFFRRFIIVPFEITIPEEEQDPQLAQKIIARELSGIFNWILEGLQRLMANKGFTYSEKVNQQVDQYKHESDSVCMFLEEEGYQSHSTKNQQLKVLYIEYREYCIMNGHSPLKKINFIKRLKKYGIVIEKHNVGYVAFIFREDMSF